MTIPTVRLFPRGTIAAMAHGISGRNYSAAAGSFIDAPQHDVPMLLGNGWLMPKAGFSGVTASRPTGTALFAGETYVDTTVGAVVIWDGVNWRNVATAAVA